MHVCDFGLALRFCRGTKGGIVRWRKRGGKRVREDPTVGLHYAAEQARDPSKYTRGWRGAEQNNFNSWD